MAQTYLTLSTYPPWPSMVLCNVILDHLMAWWTPQLLWRVSLCSWLVLKAPAERTSDVNDFVIAKLINLFVLNQRFVKFPLKYLIGAIISNMKGPFPFEFKEFNYSKSFHIWNCQLSKFSYSNFSHFVHSTPFYSCIIWHFIHT